MWIPHFDKLDSQIGPYAFNTHVCTLKEKGKKRKEGFNSRVQFASKGSLELWTLNCHWKWPLVCWIFIILRGASPMLSTWPCNTVYRTFNISYLLTSPIKLKLQKVRDYWIATYWDQSNDLVKSTAGVSICCERLLNSNLLGPIKPFSQINSRL